MDQSVLRRALAVLSAVAIVLLMVLVSMRVWPSAVDEPGRSSGPQIPRLVAPASTTIGVPPRQSFPPTNDGSQPSTNAPADASASADLAPPDLGADEPSCAVRRYTPPTALDPFEGDLCRPGAAQRDVAVVLVHGGGGVGGERADFGQWERWYLDQGFVTFNIDYRLLDPAVDFALFPQPEANVKAAIQYLRLSAEELGIAPDRIVVHGASAGARLGGMVLVTPNDPAFSATDRWPFVSDAAAGFIGFYGYYNGWQFEPEAYYGGSIPGRANVESLAAGFSGPVFLSHGTADGLISVELSQQFAEALSAAGADVTLSFPPGENHVFDGYDGPVLTEAGEAEAAKVLFWLEDHFG
ncbi:MAG: alpha/beta hydrolase [Acidimicrobiales bacterium]|nr:alpha/beta hydrolase [Acidimicrobiales bacterium]